MELGRRWSILNNRRNLMEIIVVKYLLDECPLATSNILKSSVISHRKLRKDADGELAYRVHGI
jgi:hypothetical protein